MWFEKLLGFKELNAEQVRSNIHLKGNKLISKVNYKEYTFGKLIISNLSELRKAVNFKKYNSQITINEVIADIKELHKQTINANAVFQVASQFNLLEMISPNVSPEQGVSKYEYDKTQGPACAIACGAGTIYRNYFANVKGKIGQTTDNQINCLEGIAKELQNDKYKLWEMKNGYAIANYDGLQKISNQINKLNDNEYEILKGKLQIGIQQDTEVTVSNSKQLVTQIYCSALPVAYSNINKKHWETFARLILEASYEATFFTALLNYERTGNNKLFLTLIGGGAFGNDKEWIFDAIKHSINKFNLSPLEINIVSYGKSNPDVKHLETT